MPSVIEDSIETYRSDLGLVYLFSIPFIIAFMIPLLAPLPTYISAGSIFIRTASIFTNLNLFGVAVIIAALFFSLLFVSFAFVAISLVVKSKRTHLKISTRVLRDIEKYVGRVFLVLLVYMIILIGANVLGYLSGFQDLLTGIVGLFGFIFVFYAPSAIVVDDKKICRAVKDSVKLVIKEPNYFVLWLVLIVVVLSVLDAVFIAIAGTFWSRYIMLVVSSLIVLPYFVIFQAEAYMKRFPILKH